MASVLIVKSHIAVLQISRGGYGFVFEKAFLAEQFDRAFHVVLPFFVGTFAGDASEDPVGELLRSVGTTCHGFFVVWSVLARICIRGHGIVFSDQVCYRSALTDRPLVGLAWRSLSRNLRARSTLGVPRLRRTRRLV